MLRRELPHARQGKGEALNHGIRLIRDRVAARGQDPAETAVCVMDADGRLSDRALAASFTYLRRDRQVGPGRALLLGHSFVVMNYLSFLCAWRALFRMFRGHTGWTKTTRETEPGAGSGRITGPGALAGRRPGSCPLRCGSGGAG
ncbi:hypothetical protein ACH4FX_41065 [Streptomyces sp. NPDC018019]|uniref:hypothetical protein n=1 Tax=Streptomyces sp. NPDC018019 TaxID=3365030 RepID=UPI0037A632BE